MTDARFFKNSGAMTLEKIIEISGGELAQPLPKGVTLETLIEDVSPLGEAESKHISFLHTSKYTSDLKGSKAGVCILDPKDRIHAPEAMALVLTDKPYRSYAMVAKAFYPDPLGDKGQIHDSAHVHSSAKIGKNVTLQAGVVIQEDVTLGEGTIVRAGTVVNQGVQVGDHCDIGENCVLSHTLVGSHVTLAPGVKVGQPGFGFYMDESGHVNVPQLGRVLIKDHVEIGANTTIDRGTSADTVIGEGSRIDNLVQLGHNVHLGRGCVIVAQVGISGSTRMGDYCVAAGQSGFAGHLNVGKGVRIAAKSGVMRDISDGETVAGCPAIPVKKWHRQTVALSKLAGLKTTRSH
ncbi:MAG: UDP-3-O-(3-hydroxymyristoyl)glucosamine N-acyltransferase [bacterium]|nr:UDP-3-O-(3-hydroxymyristoyl)glucosamine N-acyltransferase [bacterium]